MTSRRRPEVWFSPSAAIWLVGGAYYLRVLFLALLLTAPPLVLCLCLCW